MRTRDSIMWIWRASSGVRWRVVFNSLFGILHVAASLTFVVICKRMIDIVTTGDSGSLNVFIGIMAGCMLMQILLSALEQRVSSYSDVVLKNNLRHSLFTKLMEGKWNGKENFHSGDTLNRVMEDVRVVTEAITKSVPSIISACIQFCAAFIFLFTMAPGLAWTIPCILIAVLVISKRYLVRMRKLTMDIRNTEGKMQSLMQESLQHRLVINTLERTQYVSETLAGQQEDLRDQTMDKTGYNIFARILIQIGFSTGYAAAFLWGVLGIKNGAVTFGMMTAFLQLVGQLQRPIMNISRQVSPMVNSLTSAERLHEIESQPMEEQGEPEHLGNPVGIRFDNVSYSYPGSAKPVLEGFSHDFIPGTTTALVGETGAGKSTMMRLMLGLLLPDKGSVSMYDSGTSVHVTARVRCNIVYVPQGNTLMSGTIRENLLLGDPDATEQQMKDALYLAAADFVSNLPEGLNTICGEKGAGLSEGQAQRIAIARSLLRKGGLVLLDEPTSALDAETEVKLLERLTSKLNGRTMIIVTHREATAALCDDIIRV